jgi:predicted metalloprotease with PDZ domain
MKQTQPSFIYSVAMSQPQTHLFEVTLEIKNWQDSVLDLKMPVWTPGSYLVREYARLIQDFQAETQDKQPITSQKISKNHWQLDTENISDIIVKYQVFANDLSVRTNHLDATHGYFNGAALFFFITGFKNCPFEVKINPPDHWKVATALPSIANSQNRFKAPDFDTLVDCPFEIGTHQLYEFEVLGKKHQLAIWGDGNADPQKIIEDISKIIATEAKLFGGLPYDNYLFILHLSASGYGGLEHKNSCSLNYPRLGFRNTEKYQRFLQLVAHEFFHLWNVKLIRPKGLETFDYTQENYTTSLWFSEGTTSYYDLLIPLWAGIYDSQTFLENCSKEITRFFLTPGRQFQPVSESSFDAWIKLYRRDANSDNCQVSYYLKGELITLLLDLLIREKHQNKRSFNDVLVKMWYNFGKLETGFTPEQLKTTIEQVAETDLTDFYRCYIDGTEELPFCEYLEPFGLEIKPIQDEEIPYLGLRLQSENGKTMVKFVEVNSPAWLVGIDPEDELLAIDGFRVSADQLNERLKDYQSGDKIEVTVFDQDRLKTFAVELASPQPSRYQVVKMQHLTTTQKHNFLGWVKPKL